MLIALDGIRTCTSGIRAHRASDYTTMAGTPRVSRNKHFRHPPASLIVKQSCTKYSNSYLCVRGCARACARARLRACMRACVCVRERRKIELTVRGTKVPIALGGIRTCTSGIRAHCAADYTTKVGPASRQSKRTL